MFDRKKYRAEYYKKNKERILEQSRKRYIDKSDQIKEQRKRFRDNETPEQRAKRLAFHKRYNKENRTAQKERMSSVEYRYEYYYKRNAQKRGYEFSLTFDTFKPIFESPCEYCGKNPAKGVDRKDNGRGYVPGNSVPCCGDCNKMKWIHSKSDFLKHVLKIAKHNKMV